MHIVLEGGRHILHIYSNCYADDHLQEKKMKTEQKVLNLNYFAQVHLLNEMNLTKTLLHHMLARMH